MHTTIQTAAGDGNMKEVSIIGQKTFARELNCFLDIQAAIKLGTWRDLAEELGTWRDLAEEYLKLKKSKHGDNGKWPPQNVYSET